MIYILKLSLWEININALCVRKMGKLLLMVVALSLERVTERIGWETYFLLNIILHEWNFCYILPIERGIS